MNGDVHLRSIELRARPHAGFPFSVPTIAALERLDLAAAVTFFVGENGSGKSTLLEAIAVLAHLPVVGSEPIERDPSLAPQRELAKALRAQWTKRTPRGFFLRAEDFFGFTKQLHGMKREMGARLAEVEEEFRDASAHTRGLAAGPAAASLADMQRLYGDDFDAHSHGESFLELFRARFVPNGLYLLDEPEAALSPQSQLALIAMIAEMVAQGAQFIIATHSPILLAYPDAYIYSFDDAPIERAAFDDLPHVTLTRAFLADPAGFVRRLMP